MLCRKVSLKIVMFLLVLVLAPSLHAQRRDSVPASTESELHRIDWDTLISTETIQEIESVEAVEEESPERERRRKDDEETSTEPVDAKSALENMEKANLKAAEEATRTILNTDVREIEKRNQEDTVFLLNGNVLVGEIKNLDKGVLTIETEYSEQDFQVEWTGIVGFSTTNKFLITTNKGMRLTGSLERKDDSLIVVDNGINQLSYTKKEIVEILSFDDRVIDRISVQMDVGYSYKLAAHEHQFNAYIFLGYDAPRWHLYSFYNGTQSLRDSVDATKRHEWNINYRFFLPKDWFLDVNTNFLKSTELSLDLRTVLQGGGGYYIIHSNQSIWNVGFGLAFLNESFDVDTLDDLQNFEGYLSTEFNVFPVGDLDLIFRLSAYPSFSDWGRWRIDGTFDIKYDLPRDFYIKAGIVLNYDNRPETEEQQLDYVITSGIGWEL